jgi:cytochrome P450
MAAAGEAQAARWRTPAVRDVEHDMTDVTFDVIAATVLGGCDEPTADLIKASVDDYLAPIAWDIAFGILELPRWLWYPRRGRQRRSAARIRTELGKIVSGRRAARAEHDDLLGRLMSARGAEDGAALSETELVDNLATFLVAGHETTAKALTWTLYLLARAPEWQDRIRAEVAAVAAERTIAAGDLDRLVVTEMVLKEAMRLYPPAPVMSRQAAADGMLGGHAIKTNALITIPIYAMHRHRQLWDDPDRFDPERFAPAVSGKLGRTQFMPFGFGPRTCIGSVFAMIEAKVLLATFVRAARFGWDGRHMPEPVSRVTLRPKGGMPLAVDPIAAPSA